LTCAGYDRAVFNNGIPFSKESCLNKRRHLPDQYQPGALAQRGCVCLRVSFESVLALFPSTTTELPFT
jgi:hypothetical protein